MGTRACWDESSPEFNELKMKRAEGWRRELYKRVPEARRKWGDRSNMFFFVSAKALMLTDTDLQSLSAEEGEYRAKLRHHSQVEVQQLMDRTVNKVRIGAALNF